MSQRPTTAALVLAGGTGSRMGRNVPKQYIEIAGRPVLVHTLQHFEDSPLIDRIAVVANGSYHRTIKDMAHHYGIRKLVSVVESGDTRQHSSRNGMNLLGTDPPDIVFIHDAARPFLPAGLLHDLLEAALSSGAAASAVRSTDTAYISDGNGYIQSVPDRSFLYNAQTPQVFRYGIIRDAHVKALEEGICDATDDAVLVLRLGKAVRIVEGSYDNIKMTTPKDLDFAKRYLAGQ